MRRDRPPPRRSVPRLGPRQQRDGLQRHGGRQHPPRRASRARSRTRRAGRPGALASNRTLSSAPAIATVTRWRRPKARTRPMAFTCGAPFLERLRDRDASGRRGWPGRDRAGGRLALQAYPPRCPSRLTRSAGCFRAPHTRRGSPRVGDPSGCLLSQEGGRRAPLVRRLPCRARRPPLAAGARDAPDPCSARGRDRRARGALGLELPRQRGQRGRHRRAARRAARRGGHGVLAVPREPRRALARLRHVRQPDVLVAARGDGDAGRPRRRLPRGVRHAHATADRGGDAAAAPARAEAPASRDRADRLLAHDRSRDGPAARSPRAGAGSDRDGRGGARHRHGRVRRPAARRRLAQALARAGRAR